LHNVLGLQEEVAQDIARQIRIMITPQEQARLSSARPVNPQAHEDCLRGVYFWNKRTEQALKKSIEYFNQALQKDPSYALPYAGLANAYNSLGFYAHVAPREIYPKARVAALKAVALDDTLAEAHAALGFYYSNYEWDQPGSDREYRRAIALNPGYALAHVWRGETLSALERHTEAVTELDRARQLDPMSLMVSDQRGWVLYMARRYDDAIEQIRRTIELEPRFAHAHCWLGKAYLQKGMLREGLAELQETLSLPGGDSPLLGPWLGYAYALSGKRAEAFKVINTMKAREQRSFGSPFGIAAIYCGLAEKDQALAWLEKAYQERDPQFSVVAIEPPFDPLRSDAHFQDLVRRSTLPP
jgi:tetratricopeptide (TPR) repeat protein